MEVPEGVKAFGLPGVDPDMTCCFLGQTMERKLNPEKLNFRKAFEKESLWFDQKLTMASRYFCTRKHFSSLGESGGAHQADLDVRARLT